MECLSVEEGKWLAYAFSEWFGGELAVTVPLMAGDGVVVVGYNPGEYTGEPTVECEAYGRPDPEEARKALALARRVAELYRRYSDTVEKVRRGEAGFSEVDRAREEWENAMTDLLGNASQAARLLKRYRIGPYLSFDVDRLAKWGTLEWEPPWPEEEWEETP